VPDSDIVQVSMAAQAFFRGKLAGSWVPGYLAGRGLGPDISRAERTAFFTSRLCLLAAADSEHRAPLQ